MYIPPKEFLDRVDSITIDGYKVLKYYGHWIICYLDFAYTKDFKIKAPSPDSGNRQPFFDEFGYTSFSEVLAVIERLKQ